LHRVQLVPSTSDLEGDFDLVVVDGHQIMDVTQRIAQRGVVLVEGDRPPQRDALDRSGRDYCVKRVRTLRMMAPDDPWEHADRERYQGGYWLFRFEPTVADRVRFGAADWWSNRLIGWRRRVRRAAGRERV
jgi:hypothetical protein